ncbi:prepilin-type N-terminal cleavage/methylation domain-containing protein [Roseiconus nitratireducens]|uniref:Prepilin-type N-terminal cleavage/methylation domain-containing protein n=1 Tax=Roseiconus nitratireducens TaxID=2605748 RepID=A0A5M6D0S1_9BACT|nr:prepilin-type N-terminal cleavage/methylation domain-containing protein [Roseiconus nitratireducens]KAA5541081.1 prepilin-type N-terminal cleavage/methylation domain-containing protein [Roseiconus nitratireducens]
MKKRSGFTLIELTAACVLASIMMVALLRVVIAMAGESVQLRQQEFDAPAAGNLAARLHDDLINARGMAVTPDSILMAGFVGEDLRAGQVRYQRLRRSQRSVLVRRQGQRSELMWIGFAGFQVTVYEQDDEPRSPDPAGGGLPAVPSRFRVTLVDESGRVLCSEVIDHHAP